jgi:hypothetical protein
LASLRAAVVPEGEIVLESTPNGAAGLFYEEWQKAEESGYTRHFFPWWFEGSYKEDVSKKPLGELTEEEKDLIARHGLTAEQIAWRRTRWRILRDQAEQEFAEDQVSCFLASGECVFDLEKIEKASALAAAAMESKDNGRLMIWLPPQEKKQYIIGVDAAGGGTDGDYACVQVVDRGTGLQCAEWHGHFPPYELARNVVQLGKQFRNALVAVERNNHGYGVLAHLKDLGYENLFVRDGQEGWPTNVVTRPAMIENLAAILIEEPSLFHSARLLGELKTFVRHADGHGAAAEGAHDDCVMAMAIALAVRKEDSGHGSGRRVGMASVELG